MKIDQTKQAGFVEHSYKGIHLSNRAVPCQVCVYDGDTPFGERPEMRENADVLITNPDMLHVAMLPAHKQFARILTNLR